MAVGLMSAGIGDVPAEQTYLDVGQGARTTPRSTTSRCRRSTARRRGAAAAHPLARLGAARSRAGAPRPTSSPGCSGSTLAAAGGARSLVRWPTPPIAMVVSEDGRLPDPARCTGAPARSWTSSRPIRPAGRACGPAAGRRPADRDRAAAPGGEQGARGRDGRARGFGGTLTSDSTRMRRLRARPPTWLPRCSSASASRCPSADERRADPRPRASVDPGFVERLADRLAAIGPRRGPVVGVSLLIWVGADRARRDRLRAPRPARGALRAGGRRRVSAGCAPADGGARAQRAGRAPDRRGRPAGARARHPAPRSAGSGRWRSPAPSRCRPTRST